MLAEYYYCSFSLSKMDFLKDLKRFLHPIQLCSIMCNYARLETQGSRPEAFGLFQYIKLVSTSLPGRILSYGSRI